MTRTSVVFIAAVVFCGTALYGQSQKSESSAVKWDAAQHNETRRRQSVQRPKSDNTKINKLDREQGGLTADQQKMNARDREITRRIRKIIVNGRTLSVYAHNIKIITRDGFVTLKGPVRSEVELSQLEAAAVEVAGAAYVRNELTVAPNDSSEE